MIFKFIYTQAYRLINGNIHKLEYDAKTQYNFHRLMAFAWLLSMVAVPFFDHPNGSTALVALVILEVSLYANFATEFGAMSAALAALPPHGNTPEQNERTILPPNDSMV